MSCIFKYASEAHRENIKKSISDVIDKIITDRTRLYSDCGNPVGYSPDQIIKEAMFDIQDLFLNEISLQERCMR